MNMAWDQSNQETRNALQNQVNVPSGIVILPGDNIMVIRNLSNAYV